MSQSYETTLKKYAVPNRRGVWTSFGSGGSWESILFDAVGDDPAEIFRHMSDVQSIVEIEKRNVLTEKFDPPDGAWMLLIQPQHQKWNWLAGPSAFQEIIRAIARAEPGRWLRTGYQKTSGALYVELYEAGRRRLFLSSDGAAWDEPEDDEDELDGFLEFESDDYPAEWPLEYQTIDDVHQQLMIDLDAYDPCCVWDGHLIAMHGDAVAEQNIARVDLVRFGHSKTTPYKHRSKSRKIANADLIDGIIKHDLKRVQNALANDANRTKLPGTPSTAMGLAINHLNWHFRDSVKIVLAILDVGGDPNDGGVREPSPIARLVNHPTVLATDAVGLIDSLVKAGCDIKQLSDMPWETSKKASLDVAVSKNRIDLVLCLLSHGAGGREAGVSSGAVTALIEKSMQKMSDGGDIQPPRGLREELREFVREEHPHESMRYLAGRLAFYEEQFQKQSRDALQSLSDAVPKVMDRLTKIVRGEKVPPREKSPVLFEPDLATAMSLPERIKLRSIDHLNWADVAGFIEMNEAMRRAGFESIGCYIEENESHQLEAFIHSENKLYGIVTQIDGHVFCYTLYRYARQRYLVSIDYDSFRSEVIDGFFMEPAINSPLDSVIRQLFDYHDFVETKRKPLVPDASTFERDYARGYETFRKRLIAAMQRSEDNEDA